ncbi:hypothetical protein J421_0554 [Gemmatirosa kalamazoonensis]|uniref:Tetratricopeptide repeat protein n=1 Tax=Gemmatirosa kalamazoonensis TaxID=861299 RepID=W0RBB4_9BACT|nr:hypothetical protein [Gemmatirosa kalamazoonensis]AHG88091.1 hypothetical protein J421_0554 [Gemmatirosa kalamazoonensis]
MRRLLAALLAAVLLVPSLPAQRPASLPKRPRLGDVADTNDAHAYLEYGMRNVAVDPGSAADAFYWAMRIDPGLADAFYGRRVALLLSQDGLMNELMRGTRRGASKGMRALDSLQLRAVMLNPFLYRRLDLEMLRTYWTRAIEHAARQEGGQQPSSVEINHAIDVWLSRAGPYMRGWMAYGSGDFSAALSNYASAMKETKEKADLRVERGRIFGQRANADSAIAEFRQALVELRARDAKDVVVLYNSKAVLEQAIGMLLEQQDSVGAAREAYGRALQEDLSYWPAHVRLGMVALTAQDTAAALSELTLASQIAPDEAYVHALVGAAMVMIRGKADDALTELKTAAELEPYYALPHVTIGRIYEAASFTDEALAAYRAFLARASRHDAQREFVEQRVAALTAAAKP